MGQGIMEAQKIYTTRTLHPQDAGKIIPMALDSLKQAKQWHKDFNENSFYTFMKRCMSHYSWRYSQVLMCDDSIVGFALVDYLPMPWNPEKHCANIHIVYIKPPHNATETAQILIKSVEDVCEQANIEKVTVDNEFLTDNTLESLGYSTQYKFFSKEIRDGVESV